MTSLVQQYTNELTGNVLDHIKNVLFPSISVKFSIPLEELLAMVDEPAPKIVAKPKKPMANGDLCTKVTEFRKQNKILNISTGRAILDNPANRKKYKFYDELCIAGTDGDEKLVSALKLLGAPVKKPVPVHVLAAKAKQREFNVDDYAKPQEDEPHKNVPVKRVKKEKSVPAKSGKEEETTPVPSEKCGVKKKSLPKDEPQQTKEPSFTIRKTKKILPTPVVPTDDDAVNLSDILETSPELRVDYDSKLKGFVSTEYGFIVKKKGSLTTITGKSVDDQIVPLDDSDKK